MQRHSQLVLELQTSRRDTTTHLVMSPLEFMKPSIERPVCGGQIRWFYVSSWSRAPPSELNLDALDVPDEAARRTFVVRRQWVAAMNCR